MEEGVSILVGTSDADRMPHAARCHGAIVDRERNVVTIYLPDVSARGALENLRKNPQIAVSFARPRDYAAFQIKGACIGLRPATTVDCELIRRYVASFAEANRPFGIADLIMRWLSFPATAVDILVKEVFTQRPGPHAGERL